MSDTVDYAHKIGSIVQIITQFDEPLQCVIYMFKYYLVFWIVTVEKINTSTINYTGDSNNQ